jgi:hypothetical protein
VVVISTSSSLSHNGLTMLATGNLYVHAARSFPYPLPRHSATLLQLHPCVCAVLHTAWLAMPLQGARASRYHAP